MCRFIKLRCELFGNYPACADVSGDVVSGEVADFDTGNACVNEFECSGSIISADHDAYMPYIFAAAARCEEYQVAFAEVVALDGDSFGVLHTRGRADLVAELPIDIAGETRAVESIGAFGAVYVSFADMAV